VQAAPLFATDGPAGAHALWRRSADGLRLRMGIWASGARGTVLILPGRTETVEKYGRVAADLAAAGWGVLTLDWRGQGLSDGRPAADPSLGHVVRFAEYQRDLDALLAAAGALGAARPWMMLAHSMGGCIGLRALSRGIGVAAASFSAPMWGLPLTRATQVAARALGGAARLAGRAPRAVPGERAEFRLEEARFDDNWLTSDRDQFARMQAQVRRHRELTLGAPTLGWLVAALAEMGALSRLPSPALPAYAGVGSREKIVDPAAIAARMACWPEGRFETFPGAEHELMMEAPASRRRFLAATLALFERAAGQGSAQPAPSGGGRPA
jgi:lysophospholipase